MAKAKMNRRPKVGPPNDRESPFKRVALGSRLRKPVGSFSERKPIEKLAAEQGVRLDGQLERVLGTGAELWASDEDFRRFAQGIHDRRREGTSVGKP